MPWAALGEALVWVLKQELRLEICIGSHLVGAGRGQGGKNMISCSVFWIKTLWLQSHCSPGEQTWLNYAEITGLNCSAAARRGQSHVKPEAETDGTFVALRPDPGFQGNPRFSALPSGLLKVSSQPHVPAPIQAHAESCLLPRPPALNTQHQGLVQPAVSPPEPTLRWVAWLSSDYGCREASGGSCQEG